MSDDEIIGAKDQAQQNDGEDPFGDDLDDLLDAESSGLDQGAGVEVAFDFTQPHDISRIFEQNLRSVGENLSKAAAISFTNLFRANSALEFKGVTLAPCGEYLDRLPKPTCISTFTMPPFQGRSVLNLDLSFCYTLVKKLMGGAVEPEENLREYTEIERTIVQGLLSRLLEVLKEACSRLITVTPELVVLENNADYIAGVASGDTLVVLSFEFTLDMQTGDLDVCIPMSSFAPVRDVFDPQERREMRAPHEVRQERRHIMDVLNNTSTEIVVKLAEMETNLETITQLREGDILHLTQPVDSPMLVEVADKLVFIGEAGRIHQQRAVKLTQRMNKE
ncbi:MAG: FliM/FliN family flagellar motor switch protein [bacterium]